MLSSLDRLIDRTTMYRLVLYYLLALLGGAFLLGMARVVAIDPTALVFSTVLLLAASLGANLVFAAVFGAVPNRESASITALILALILDPVTATNLAGVGLLLFAAVWAMASKYILSARRRHIFNPAALGVALPGLLLNAPASWWVSTVPYLLPIIFVGGLMVVRKLRRFDLILAFAAANLAATVLTAAPGEAFGAVKLTLLESPFFFMAFVMLTEPLTAPQHRLWRLVYGALVGILSSPNIAIAGYYFSPEVALLVGNLVTFLASPKGRVMLTLERVEEVASGAYDFVFRPDRRIAFAAGQYLEWTLPVRRPDDRGNRRYFTIASAPSEELTRLGVKFSAAGSAFKRELAELQRGDTIVASQLAGSFTLPRNADRKLAFIAGGIGITPFRSMLKELLERNESRPIIVLYGNRRASEIGYRDVLDEVEARLGIPTYHAVVEPAGATPDMTIGFIDAAMIRAKVPDFRERVFYISGPQAMVAAERRLLRRMGVPFWRIKTDFFPGLA
jgi:ferredoxin-NADP reductase/Na+-translocating ferredoxin:NAD+ oxidoreductase RnfD subunit